MNWCGFSEIFFCLFGLSVKSILDNREFGIQKCNSAANCHVRFKDFDQLSDACTLTYHFDQLHVIR